MRVRKKILIVEDDLIVSNIYRNKLANEGYDATIAQDGEIGKQMLKSFKPEMVLLDLMMPRVNGVELIKHIRSQRETKNLPVIVLSNSYLTSLIQEAWAAGANRCLSKSECNPRQLGDVIEKVFKEFDARPIPMPPPLPESTPAPAPVQMPSAPAAPAPRRPAPAPAATPVPVRAPAPGRAPASAPAPIPMPAYFYVPAPTPYASAPPSFTNTEADLAFQADLQKSFLDSVGQNSALMRTATHQLVKADSEGGRLVALSELYKRITSLTGTAGLAGMTQLARMSAALEALLKELQGKPGSITPSAVRTITHAVDVIAMMMGQTEDPERAHVVPPTVLVVDDEAISRRAVLYALEKASLHGVGLEDPETALMLLSDNHFDMMFLDVDMPGMSGFELCKRIRAMPEHKTTPIIFVTGLTDFESRAKSTLSGGNDLIAKPFIFMELALKALTLILKAQLTAEQA